MYKTTLGDLGALRQMTVAELRVRWRELYGEDSRSRNKDFLWRRLAWRVQELAYGGLSDAAKARLAELAPSGFVRAQLPRGFAPGPAKPIRDRRLPSPGATLVRRYKGVDVRVLVLDDGFEYDGRRYESLTEIARVVTGSARNGWLFFGLTKRQRAR